MFQRDVFPSPPLDVIASVDGEEVIAELDIRNNARVRVGDQYGVTWKDGTITILRVERFRSAETYNNTIARRIEAMREGVAGVPDTMTACKAYQVKLAVLRIEGELLPNGIRMLGASRVPNVMVPLEPLSDDTLERFVNAPDGNVILGNLRVGGRVLPRVARLRQNYAGERMVILGTPGSGKSQLLRALLSQMMAETGAGKRRLVDRQPGCGFLILDRKGEYIKDTLDEWNHPVYGLHHHPAAKEQLVIVSPHDYSSWKQQGRIADYLPASFSMKDIDPIDLVDFLPGWTLPQADLLRDYGHIEQFYDKLLRETQCGFIDKRTWFADFPGLFEIKEPGKHLLKQFEERAVTEQRTVLLEEEREQLQEHFSGTKSAVLEHVATKIKRFCHNPFFGGSEEGGRLLQRRSCVKTVLRYLAEGKCVFIDMQGQSDENYTIVAALFARRLLTYNRAQSMDTRHIHACLVMEEAHNILGAEEMAKGNGRGSVFIQLAREGRTFKLGFVLVTQQPDVKSIDVQIIKTIDTVVAFHMPFDDARHIQRLKAGFAGLEREICNAPTFRGVAIADAGPILFQSTPVDTQYMCWCADGLLPIILENQEEASSPEENGDEQELSEPVEVPSREERLAQLIHYRQETIAEALATLRAWKEPPPSPMATQENESENGE